MQQYTKKESFKGKDKMKLNKARRDVEFGKEMVDLRIDIEV